jgi:hypothetical protein
LILFPTIPIGKGNFLSAGYLFLIPVSSGCIFSSS